MEKDFDSYAIVNAHVVKSYLDGNFYDGIVVVNGRVLYVGNSDVAKLIARQHGLEVIDKKGLFLLPGFIDAHMHVESLGITLKTLSLSSVSSIEELVSLLKKKIQDDKPHIVVGRGWDHERFVEKRMPTAKDLDRASRDIPIVLSRVCGHVVVVNSVVLETLRDELQKFPDSYVPRSENGLPIGLLFEDAGYLAWNYASSFLDKKEVLREALNHLVSLGITSVGWMSVNESQLNVLAELNSFSSTHSRLYLYIEDYLLEKGMYYKTVFSGSDKITVNGVKLFADGSLGARTAYLSEDYSDKPGWRGVLLMDENKIVDKASMAIQIGLQPATHAIGDEAIRHVIKAYRRINAGEYAARIEHVSLAPPDIVESLAKLKLIAVVQPRFVVSDWWAGQRLGERVRYLYPFRTMLARGVRMAFSTDAPVEPANPWLTVQAAENNREEEKLRRAEALYLYTEGSAIALRRRDIGRLEPGYKADFIITNFNPFTLPNDYLPEARVLETYVGGRKVYPAQ
jgi:predicted amidohydrolase YtcJ